MPNPADQNPPFPGQGHDTGPGDTRPYLCIPYWKSPRFSLDPVDIGLVRPLPSGPPPAGVVSWECTAIHASVYSPGAPLDVTVDVRNSGGGSTTAIATVIVYWADPTVGFAKPNFFGATTVTAPPMRDPSLPGFVSASFAGTIPATAPSHICLLACVTHSLDAAGTAPDPVNDRHWAQHNIVAVAPKVLPVLIPFVAGNPFDREQAFVLHARVLDPPSLEALALRRNMEPGEGRIALQLIEGGGRAAGDGHNEARLSLKLGRHGRQHYALRLQVDPLPAAGQLLAVELLLHQGNDQQRTVGSLGVLIQGRL